MHVAEDIHNLVKAPCLYLVLHPVSSSARKPGGSEYVNIGTPEETLLETYFVTLSKFNFDRAREQCVSLSHHHIAIVTVPIIYSVHNKGS